MTGAGAGAGASARARDGVVVGVGVGEAMGAKARDGGEVIAATKTTEKTQSEEYDWTNTRTERENYLLDSEVEVVSTKLFAARRARAALRIAPGAFAIKILIETDVVVVADVVESGAFRS